MKKTAVTLLTFAAAILTVSCQKENIREQEAFTPMIINAESNGVDILETKTSLAFKFDVNWSANDKIYVTDGDNHNTFSLVSGENTTKGTFKQDDSPVTFTKDVEAYYPSFLFQDDGSFVWPAIQNNDQTIPMYCKTNLSGSTDGERMDFKSLGSVLRIAFSTSQDNITLKSIEIKDEEKAMSGTFTVSDGIAIIDNTAAKFKEGITLELGDDGIEVKNNEIKYFHIAVPAGEYKKFSIKFTTTDRQECVMTGGSINVRHNTVGTLSLIGTFNEPTTHGEADASIDDTSRPVKWVQLWEGGPKFAEYNVGANNATSDGTQMNHEAAIQNSWGDKWKIPTPNELLELVKAASSSGDEKKVICGWKTEGNVYGIVFTGKGSYAFNSVYFPVLSDGVNFLRSYWSTYENMEEGNFYFHMELKYTIESSQWDSSFIPNETSEGEYFVRLVLNEEN